ncbi:MAG TPA: transposase [Gammaproteobacteria bacterium]
MPRHPRLSVAGFPHHVTQRGNNRQSCFFSNVDYRFFLELLGDACDRHECKLHAYVLMTNHVHLLITPASPESLSLAMRDVGREYVRSINARQDRTGTLWEGRFRSSLVDSERYCLACYRYIELNPVRAGIVVDPRDYAWSSIHENATGEPGGLVSPHPLWLELGRSPKERAHAYIALFDQALRPSELLSIRESLKRTQPIKN